MSLILKGVLSFVASMAALTGIDYVMDVLIYHEPITPGWGLNALLALVITIFTVVGPDAARHKKNR